MPARAYTVCATHGETRVIKAGSCWKISRLIWTRFRIIALVWPMKPAVMAPGLAAGRERLVLRLERCGLERSTIEAVLSRHTLVRYPRRAKVFARGAPADVIFAVLAGAVKISCGDDADRHVILALAGPGDVAGFADFRDVRGNRSQLFDAEALTSVTIAIITRDHLMRTIGGLPTPALAELCGELNSFWAGALARSAAMLGMSLRGRLESVLTQLAVTFGVPDARGLMLPLELGQQELAAMIGGSRPMVGKLLLDLARDGFLLREGRRYILAREGYAACEPRAASPAVNASPCRRSVTR
jgi:CRP/FNR family cyclic AMP-dependent transcriptional regulator